MPASNTVLSGNEPSEIHEVYLRMRVTISALTFLLALALAPQSWGEERGSNDARQHFGLGQQHEERGELERALAAYERAFELRPSYRLHRHIGRVCRALGRISAALEHYELFLAQGAERLTAEQRRRVAEMVNELRGQLCTLTITAPAGAEVMLDGRSLGTAPLAGTLDIDPGRHGLEVRLAGHEEHSEEFSLAQGEQRSLEIQLAPVQREVPPPLADPIQPPMVEGPATSSEPTVEQPSLVGPWVLLGAGLALALTGGVLDIVAYVGAGREADDSFGDQAEYDEWYDGVVNTAIAGDVLVGVGGAAAVAGLIWLLVTRSRRGEAVNESASAVSVSIGGTDGPRVMTTVRF